MCGSQRYAHQERRALTIDAGDHDRAAVKSDQLLDQSETDAAALVGPSTSVRHAVKPFEDARQLRIRDADAGVTHRQLGRPVSVRRSQPDLDLALESELERV